MLYTISFKYSGLRVHKVPPFPVVESDASRDKLGYFADNTNTPMAMSEVQESLNRIAAGATPLEGYWC